MTFIGQWIAALTLALSATVGDSLSTGCGGTKNLTAFVGENLSLPTGSSDLHGDFQALWTMGDEKLATYELGSDPEYHRANLSLDQRTGALTLITLSTRDSGVYEGEIINGDNQVCRFTYKVSVSEPGTNSPPGGSQQGFTRNHIAAVVACLIAVAVVVVVVVLLAARVRWVKAKAPEGRNGNNQGEVI